MDILTCAQLCTLLAQAATALAISHEAGCVNSDVKPGNMMVKKDLSSLKLIDQAGVIDLIHTEKPQYDIYSPVYCAPEVILCLKDDQREFFVTPACDVYSMGISIFEKLGVTKPVATRKKIQDVLETLFDGGYRKNCRYRKELSDDIFGMCRDWTIIPRDKAGSKFMGLLLEDCLAFNPEDRISAAQLAEILQVFSSYLQAKAINPKLKCPNYDEVKAKAIKDCPKGVPIAIRKMLLDEKETIQRKAVEILYTLGIADNSYWNTPAYGLSCVLGVPLKIYVDDAFEQWIAHSDPETVQKLKNRVYIRGQAHSEEQDMPVSEDIYEIISSAIIPGSDSSDSDEF